MSYNPMKRPPAQLQEMWDENPEPHKESMSPDPRSIIDTDLKEYEAYMWESHNCKEGWICFEGDLMDIKQ